MIFLTYHSASPGIGRVLRPVAVFTGNGRTVYLLQLLLGLVIFFVLFSFLSQPN
jgi:hypothetical protein